MKLQITDDQREFFQNHHSILFENLLKTEDLAPFQEAVHRLFLNKTSKEKFEKGRNLWKLPKIFEKMSFLKRLGEILCQLQNETILRIAYDQYYPIIDPITEPRTGKYSDFLKQTLTLQEMSSVRGLVGGAFITLSDLQNPTPQSLILFFHPEATINWPDFAHKECFLVVYAQTKSFFLKSMQDPHSGSFIQLGYSSGDRLNDKNNPVIFKKNA